MSIFKKLGIAALTALEQNIISPPLAERVRTIAQHPICYKNRGLELHELLFQLSVAAENDQRVSNTAIEALIDQIESQRRRRR